MTRTGGKRSQRLRSVALACAIGVALFLTGCAGPEIGNANGFSPYATWKQIETEHFRIAFPEELEPLAQKTGTYFEDAHRVLSPRLRWEPFKKTSVVLVDNTDDPNGWASPQLRPGIALFVSFPTPASSANYYEDWLRLLAFHEYTHFLNIDTAEGVYKPLRWVAGDTLLPNAAWPSWMLEGLAVYMETRHSKGGRGRSTYWDMALRSAIADGTIDTWDGVTLDRLSGDNPYNPFGDTPYMYGYFLMRQLAQTPTTQATADGDDVLAHPEDVLGVYSQRSSHRVPYFVDDNAANLVDKTWSDVWDDFVRTARARAEKQLATIRKHPVTPWEWLIPPSHTESRQVLHPTPSPDGKWLAYSAWSSNRWEGLRVRPLGSPGSAGTSTQLSDETIVRNTREADQLSWSEDSRWLFFSTIERYQHYSYFSDLYAWNRETQQIVRLTHGRRARSPDVSRDGTHVTYVLADHGRTRLARAALQWKDGQPQLGDEQILYTPALLDRVASPRFSTDGKTIYFTQHRNGHFSEELLSMGVDAEPGRTPQTLVDNGHFNRFPWVRHAAGKTQLYYLSDVSGVDNLYLHGGGALTNLESGMRTPSVTADGTVYAAGFSSHGWELVRFAPAGGDRITHAAAAPQVEAPIEPAPGQSATPPPADTAHEVSPYSVWPSILPRSWGPQLAISSVTAFQLYGVAHGNDALELHRYQLALGFTTAIPRLDWSVTYANRNLGPTIAFNLSDATTQWSVIGTSLLYYNRRSSLLTSISFPARFTFSTLTPSITFLASQENFFVPGANSANADLVSNGTYVPQFDVGIRYSYGLSSALAIATEEGRGTTLAERTYLYSGVPSYKVYAAHTEYFRFGEGHIVLSPSIKAAYASPTLYSPALVNVTGRVTTWDPSFLLSGSSVFATAGLTRLILRGYPLQNYTARGAGVASFDVKFPLLRIFRGLFTAPVFFQNLHGFGFLESALFPGGEPGGYALPSAGAGIQFDLKAFFQLPVATSFQYHQGFRPDLGGASDFIFMITSSGLGF